jgi:hypothetical protein
MGVLGFQSIGAAIANGVLNHLTQMTHAQDYLLDAAGLQEPQLMRQERFAADLEQRFRNCFRQRSQTRCQAAGKYGHWQHGHSGVRQHGSSAEVELQADLSQPGMPHGRAKTGFVFRVQQEKASAAGADKFAAE